MYKKIILKNGVKFFAALSLIGGLLGCESAPSKPLTQLESCLEDAKRANYRCTVNALLPGSGLRADPNQKNICDDRQMQQEDRCHARFK